MKPKPPKMGVHNHSAGFNINRYPQCFFSKPIVALRLFAM